MIKAGGDVQYVDRRYIRSPQYYPAMGPHFIIRSNPQWPRSHFLHWESVRFCHFKPDFNLNKRYLNITRLKFGCL